MKNLSHDFMHLDKCEKSFSENINRSYQIDKICNNIHDQVVQSYNTDINGQNNLQKFVQNNLSQIRDNIDNKLKEVMQIII